MKLSILFAGLLLLTACTAGMSEEEIKAAVLEANTNLESYKVDADIVMTTQAQGQSMNMDIVMTGEIDRSNKKAFLSTTTTLDVLGYSQDISSDMYVDDNVIYSEILGSWFKQVGQNFWEEQDQAEQYTELIENGELEILGTENIEGTEYYVVELTLSNAYLNSYLGSTTADESLEGLDFSNYDITFYINTENFIIERNTGTLSVSQTVDGQTVTMNMQINTRIYDINEPVSISIPEEALNAKEFDNNLIGSY